MEVRETDMRQPEAKEWIKKQSRVQLAGFTKLNKGVYNTRYISGSQSILKSTDLILEYHSERETRRNHLAIPYFII